MLKARIHKHLLQFKQAAGTSRGVLHTKTVYYLLLNHSLNPDIVGIGECGTLPGLSFDDRPDYEARLNQMVEDVNRNGHLPLTTPGQFPSIDFAFEMALLDLASGGKRLLFDTPFSRGEESIPMNGLIWMGDEDFMLSQIEQKLAQGFKVLKLKIGAIDFQTELNILQSIRKTYSGEQITIRLDANGAFDPDEVLKRLKKLAVFDIHSIEQPIRQGQSREMAELCSKTPIPIVLDEELIGIQGIKNQALLLKNIRPQYIILKPTLLGGFAASKQWIELAASLNIDWWVTSALESNIGLNAIAQWTATQGSQLPQGLGTGGLYTNNIPSPLEVKNGTLRFNPLLPWDLSLINA